MRLTNWLRGKNGSNQGVDSSDSVESSYINMATSESINHMTNKQSHQHQRRRRRRRQTWPTSCLLIILFGLIVFVVQSSATAQTRFAVDDSYNITTPSTLNSTTLREIQENGAVNNTNVSGETLSKNNTITKPFAVVTPIIINPPNETTISTITTASTDLSTTTTTTAIPNVAISNNNVTAASDEIDTSEDNNNNNNNSTEKSPPVKEEEGEDEEKEEGETKDEPSETPETNDSTESADLNIGPTTPSSSSPVGDENASADSDNEDDSANNEEDENENDHQLARSTINSVASSTIDHLTNKLKEFKQQDDDNNDDGAATDDDAFVTDNSNAELESMMNTNDGSTSAIEGDNVSSSETPTLVHENNNEQVGKNSITKPELAGGLIKRHSIASPALLSASSSSSSSSTNVNSKVELTINRGNTTLSTIERDEMRAAFEAYSRWIGMGNDLIELFSIKLLPLIIGQAYEIDPQTMTGMLNVFNAVRGLKPWALMLLDSWAKLAPGMLQGTQSDFGDYDECLSIASEPTDEMPTIIRGQYCLADVVFPKPPRPFDTSTGSNNQHGKKERLPIQLRQRLLDFSQVRPYNGTIFQHTANFFHMLYVDPIRVGICLTTQVNADSFERVVNNLLVPMRVHIQFNGRCVSADTLRSKQMSPFQVVSLWVLKVALLAVACSTLIDILLTRAGSRVARKYGTSKFDRFLANISVHSDVLTSYSIVRNTRKLFAPSNQTMDRSLLVENKNQQQQQQQQQWTENVQLAVININKCDNKQLPPVAVGAVHRSSVSSLLTSSSQQSSSLNSTTIGSVSETTTDSLKEQTLINHHQHLSDDSSKCSTRRKHKESQACRVTNEEQRVGNINMSCLHGLRVITMTWMIINHTYLFGGFFVLWAYRRLIEVAEWPKSLTFQLVLNGWLTVETYFFLSALIMVYTLLPMFQRQQSQPVATNQTTANTKREQNKLRITQRQQQFNYGGYLVHRITRLLPAYLGVICLNFLWPLISSGPVWLVKGHEFIERPCEQYMWANLLFINNWFWPENMCMVHTWYLSADFQLYLVAPLLVYLLARRPVLGHTLNVTIALFAAILSAMVIWQHKLAPSVLINKLEFSSIKKQLHYSYFATYQHLGPYAMGLAIGYWLRTRPTYRVPKRVQWLLWLTLPPISFGTLLMTYLWNGAYPSPTMIDPAPTISALYVAVHRTLWTSLVAWVVFACATGCASHVNVLLSSQVFLPLSRLSYSIYLVHLPVIMFRSLNIRHTLEWNDISMLWEASGNFVASVLVAYLVNILFESPILNLEKHFRRQRSSNSNNGAKNIDMSLTKASHCVVIDSIEKSNNDITDNGTTRNSDDNSYRDDTHSSSISGSGSARGSSSSSSDNSDKLGDSDQQGVLIRHSENSLAGKVVSTNELAPFTITESTMRTPVSSFNDNLLHATTTNMLYNNMNDRAIPDVVLRRAWQDLERVTNAYGTLQRRRGRRGNDTGTGVDADANHSDSHRHLQQQWHQQNSARNEGQSVPRHYYDTYSYRIDGRTPLSSFVELSTAYDRSLQANNKHWPSRGNGMLIPRVTGTLQRNNHNQRHQQNCHIEDEDDA